MAMTDRHVALVGFMGAGKSTLAWQAAQQTGRGYVDVDSDLEGLIGPIGTYFDEHGEPAFRAVEEVAVTEALLRSAPSIVALGGGAVTSAATRELLAERATTVWLDAGLAERLE